MHGFMVLLIVSIKIQLNVYLNIFHSIYFFFFYLFVFKIVANSGTASLLEIARAYGNLLQSSWKPKRGIILASWSGEEYGLLGRFALFCIFFLFFNFFNILLLNLLPFVPIHTQHFYFSTAFGERFADELSQHAVAYFNVDTGVLGPSLFVNLVPSLHQHYLDTAGYITDPNTEKLLNETWDGSYGILGSGSDYTVFLDALGITSSDLGFGGPYGVYHSVYDDFYWMEHFGDPEFKYHQACAQYLGLLAMRVADARVLPFNFEEYHNALQVYINTTSQIAKQAGFSLDLSAVVAAVSQFGDAAAKVTAEIATANSDPQYDVVTLNRKLFLAER